MACEHTASIHITEPSGSGPYVCAACEARGDTWVHLRMCMTCGEIGCCDSSKNKHATAHFHVTGHPIVRSVERGERWRWCYVDRAVLR